MDMFDRFFLNVLTALGPRLSLALTLTALAAAVYLLIWQELSSRVPRNIIDANRLLDAVGLKMLDEPNAEGLYDIVDNGTQEKVGQQAVLARVRGRDWDKAVIRWISGYRFAAGYREGKRQGGKDAG